MRPPRYSAVCLALVVAACAKSADRTNDSAAGAVASTPPAMAPGPTAAPASAIVLADIAGKWTVVATPTDGTDTASTTTTIVATADTTGWTQTYMGRKPIPMHVRVDGDSIISQAGPYDSFRRKGVKVTTNGVWRHQGGNLVGNLTAHYSVKGPDSVLHLTVKGTKAP
jgi:hypothetical protein